VGIDAIPLRTQSDGRLVRLVREGYESAFEEIVRRYRRPLDRFAASIVGGRSEDVTQDSFRKALVALRRDGDDIELRPWLYRIVRNTALKRPARPPARGGRAGGGAAGRRALGGGRRGGAGGGRGADGEASRPAREPARGAGDARAGRA